MIIAPNNLTASMLCVMAAMLVAFPAEGAGTESIDSIIGLSEVSVSAIKATSASRFPSADTSLSQSQIDLYDINGLKGVSEIAPNFYMPQYGSRMTSTIYVRGLGTRIDQPVVALNVDNVQLLNKDNYDFNFPDLDRIEMVRGAQSILYGRNSMGGVINLSTLSPLNFQGLRVLAEYGSGQTWRVAASGYKMVSPTFGLGVIGSMNATDGFYRNKFTGNKIDTERQGLAKVKIAWRPSSRFVLENSCWTTITRQGGYPYESLATGEINHNDTCFYRRTNVVDGLTMRYFGENVSVSSITGFQYLNDNMTLDQDFLPQDYFTLTQRRHEWSLTQDFVAKGSAGSYGWLGGLYVFGRRTNMSAPVTFKDYGIESLIESNINSQLPPIMRLRWDDREMVLGSDFLTKVWGWALYHKSDYTLGKFTVSAGLRLAFERTDFDYLSAVSTSATMYNIAGPVPVAVATRPIDVSLQGRLHTTSLQLLPEIKLAYRFNDCMSLGAVVSKGYKSGGYNTQMFSDILQQAMMQTHGVEQTYETADVISYKPEYSWNYEVDFEARFPSLGLALESSIFWIDCRNQQMTMFPDGATTGRVMANAGRTRSLGVELSATYQPDRAWRFHTSYGLADARFRRFNNGIADCRGNHVPYAPENTLFGSVTWSARIGEGFLRSIEPTVSCRGIGNIYWDEENMQVQPFYALLGASVTLRTRLGEVDVWGDNLTGTRYSTFYFVSIGNGFVQRGNPRRFGVTLRLTLDADK